MEKGNVIVLENKEDYNVVKKIEYNNFTYVLLSNASNENDICVRKLVNSNGRMYVSRLDNDELRNVINEFNKI